VCWNTKLDDYRLHLVRFTVPIFISSTLTVTFSWQKTVTGPTGSMSGSFASIRHLRKGKQVCVSLVCRRHLRHIPHVSTMFRTIMMGATRNMSWVQEGLRKEEQENFPTI
jgi:hypothetical protein